MRRFLELAEIRAIAPSFLFLYDIQGHTVRKSGLIYKILGSEGRLYDLHFDHSFSLIICQNNKNL